MPASLVKPFLFILFFNAPVWVSAQLHNQTTVDSLLVLISKSPDDTTKIGLMNKLCFTYYNLDTKKGIAIGNQALKLALKIGWKDGIAKAYNNLGSNYWANYDYIRAQDYYGKSLNIAREIGDKSEIARSTHNIGTCYESENNFSKALEYYNESAGISRDIGDTHRQIGCLSNMADVYMEQSKYDNAINFYRQSLKLSAHAINRRDIGYYTQQIGKAYALSGKFDDAQKYEEKALNIFQKLKDYEDIAINKSDLGTLFFRKQDYPHAVLMNQDALRALKEIKGSSTKKMEADYYCAIGKSYFEWARDKNISPQPKNANARRSYFLLASENLEKSLSIARSVGYLEAMIESLKTLSTIQTIQGDLKSALETYKQYIFYRDSLNNSAKDKEYVRHELAFEFTRKRDSLNYENILQKKELQQTKTLAAYKLKQQSLYMIVIIVILLLIVSYFVFRNRVQKINFKSELAKEKSELQIKEILFENKLNDLTLASLKSQMKPHFIFNCLNSIKLYIEKNETEAASLYVTKFSKLIRNILDSARSDIVTLAAEIELIRLYLEMECMRFKEKLVYDFEIAGNVAVDFIEIPPLLIQPYVENAVWHGLMHKEEGGTIKLSIQTSADEKFLIVRITDNGIGRKKAEELKRKRGFQHTSHGSKLNDERIAMFNAKYKTGTEVIFSDLTDEEHKPCGTTVTIKLMIQ